MSSKRVNLYIQSKLFNIFSIKVKSAGRSEQVLERRSMFHFSDAPSI